jgi:hypothetical protein
MSSSRRIDIDAEAVGQGLGRLVVAVLELVRQLLGRQAVRRAETLAPDELERLGRALLALDERFAELREIFGVSKHELALPVEIADLEASNENRS